MIGRVTRWRTGVQDALRAARSSLLWALLSRQRRWVRAMLALFIGVTAVALVMANLTAAMIDQAIVEQTAPLRPFVPKLLTAATLYLFVQFAMSQVTARVTYQIEFELRTWLYTRIQSAEAASLDRMASGQLVTRALTDLQLVERILGIVPTLIGLLPLILGLSVFLLILSPPMGVLAIVALPANLWIISRFRHRLFALSWADLNERAEVMSAIDEPVRGIRVVKAFGREDDERARVAEVCLRAYRFAMSRVRLLARYDLFLKLIPYVFNALVLAVGAHLVAADSLTLGTFLIGFQLSQVMVRLADIFGDLASYWQYLRSAQNRLVDLLALGSNSGAEGARLPEASSGLELRDIDLELGGRRVLDGIELEVPLGCLVVLTGPPSSGKTTLAGVAAGVLPPDAGTLLLDGVELASIDPSLLRQAVRIVSEESILFAASLRENLEMGATTRVDDEALRRALWAAGAEELLDVIEEGFDGHIGDRGLTLSGGQRQRLALARALVQPPRILVLDDALAAVNPSLEIEILGRIRDHAPEMGVLCATRRPSLGEVADSVVTLPEPPLSGFSDDFDTEDVGIAAAIDPDEVAPTASLATDPRVVQLLAELKISRESPGVPEEHVTSDDKPEVRSIVRLFAPLIGLTLVALLVQSLGKLAPETLFGAVADVVEDGTSEADLRAGVLVIIGVAYTLAAYVFRILAQRVNQGLIYLLRRRTFRRLSKLGIDFYDRELPGQVAARVVHDLDTINEFLQGRGFRLVIDIGQVLAGMVLIVMLSTDVFPVVAVMALTIVAVTAAQYPLAVRAFGWSRDELGRVTAKFEEDLTGRTELRNLGAQDLQLRKFIAASWQRRRARWWSMTVANTYTSVISFIGNAGAAIVLYQAGNLVLATTLSVGSALSLRLLSTAATQPMQSIGAEYRDLLDVRVSWDRLRQPFDVELLPVEPATPQPCPAVAGDVVFEHVAFSYPHTGKQVLHDVSFRLEPRTVTALVGYTGAGKSSIAKLLGRTYDPDHGRVTVDGVDLREIDLTTYRGCLGIVPQDAFLFRGTVASNIAYGRPDAPREETVAAADAVGAGDLLRALPDAFDHVVEEEGRNLTAATRQLIALARAWLTKPSILVLDEATSCLDARLEQLIIDALGQLGCTTLMITHRREVAVRADQIVVLEGGRVAEAGSATSVAADGGAFARLWVTEGQLDDAHANRRQARSRRPKSTADRQPSRGRQPVAAGRSRSELYQLARKHGVPGRSRMSAAELEAALELLSASANGNGRGR